MMRALLRRAAVSPMRAGLFLGLEERRAQIACCGALNALPGTRAPPDSPGRSMKVGLFVTCLVDLMRPSIGFASLKLLESAGYEVIVPGSQTCCVWQ